MAKDWTTGHEIAAPILFVLTANIFGCISFPPVIFTIWTVSLLANVVFVAWMVATWFIVTKTAAPSWATAPMVFAGYVVSLLAMAPVDGGFASGPADALRMAGTFGITGILATTAFVYAARASFDIPVAAGDNPA